MLCWMVSLARESLSHTAKETEVRDRPRDAAMRCWCTLVSAHRSSLSGVRLG